MPLFATSSWWSPRSTTFPASITMISSARFTVWSLCATMMTVLSLKSISSASVIFSSEKLSRAEVGSSRSMISGSLRNIFAIARRCFCHQLNLTPRSPISVSRPFSISNTKSQWASLNAFSRNLSWETCIFTEDTVVSFLFLSEIIIFFSIVSSMSVCIFSPAMALTRFSLIVASNTHGSWVRYPIWG